MIKNLSYFNTKVGRFVTQTNSWLWFTLLYWTSTNEVPMQNNDATASWKAWQRLGDPWNLGCLSVRQVDSWQKYNHESLLRNLKLPKGWVWSSTPIEHKCSAYLEARKQTILIVLRNNRLLFQQATVIVMSKFQKRRKLLLRVSNGDVNDQNE